MNQGQNSQDERKKISENALFHVLDEQHIELKRWKEEQTQLVRGSTFSNAERFPDPKLNYTQECADRSRIDCDKHLNQDRKASAWASTTSRDWLFLNKEQVKIVEEKNKEKELLAHNLAIAGCKAEEENARLVVEKGKTGEKRKMQHSITFEGR